MSEVMHELRNHLAVVAASVQGIRDGVVVPSAARCDAILQALTEAEVLLAELLHTPLGEGRAEVAHAALATALRNARAGTEIAIEYDAATAGGDEHVFLARFAEQHGAAVESREGAGRSRLVIRLAPSAD
jgi:hypothetical protein